MADSAATANVLVVTCGGTIDKDYPQKSGGYAFEFADPPAVTRVLGRAVPGFSHTVVAACAKDSLDMTDVDRETLKAMLTAAPQRKIVVTHGSDTVADTARFVGTVSGKAIVFTCAYTPERFRDSDADFNLGGAFAVASMIREGTLLCVNGHVFVPEGCEKDSATGLFVGTLASV